MKNALYFAPVVTNGKGLPMEYIISYRPMDKRTTFHKLCAAYVCKDIPLAISTVSMYASNKSLTVKGSRIIMKDGTTAYNFARCFGFPRVPKFGLRFKTHP